MDNTGGTIRRLLTVAEVAEELRVTRGTAYRWIRTGSLPAVRIAAPFACQRSHTGRYGSFARASPA